MRAIGAWLSAVLAVVSIAHADAAQWSDYQLAIWQPQTAAAYRTLGTIGVNVGMLQIDRDAPDRPIAAQLTPHVATGMRPYIENIATDFYSAYHRYVAGRAVNWRFLELQALYRKNADDPRLFIRDPSLADPAWLGRIGARLRQTVATYRSYDPLFYDLADEAGIADLAAYWDFDFSAPSLAGFRRWLGSRYGSLAALNREWGTTFPDWNAVRPETTAAAMRRSDENYAAWSDFKEWMDVSFARAVATGRDAVHEADPAALAGLEGVQKPRWGGYDYALLARAADVMEVEDVPQDLDLLRSLNPRLRLMTTSSLEGAADEHRVWQALLEGAGGLVLWDVDHKLVTADGALEPRGAAAQSYLREIRGGIGALLLNSRAAFSPVALLYSPESLRVEWMLDWRGKDWSADGSAREWDADGAARGALYDEGRALDQLGLSPRYLAPDMIEAGALGHGIRVLVLPHVLAMSDAEAKAIRAFVEAGGRVVADVEPGVFDRHGRKRAQPPFSGAVETAATGAGLAAALGEAGIAPPAVVRGASDVLEREWRDGAVMILALQRDFDPHEAASARVMLHLPARSYVYDVRRGGFLGRQRDVTLSADQVAPAILALSPAALAPPVVRLAKTGSRIRVRVAVPHSPAAFRVETVTVADQAGADIAAAAQTLVVRGASGEAMIDLPQNARPGTWTVTVRDLLSGTTRSARIAIAAQARRRSPLPSTSLE